VRLKGGDPYLFGRGGEEAEACTAAGIPCTVVPGVTSAFAAPAYAGIPVTHRDLAQEVVVVSGHLPPGHPASTVDWRALGTSSATIVILMGVARLMDIAEALMDGGRPPATPAVVVERGATPAQRVLRTTLDALAVDAIAARVRSPAVIVIGEVASRHDAAAPVVSGVPGMPVPFGGSVPAGDPVLPGGDPVLPGGDPVLPGGDPVPSRDTAMPGHQAVGPLPAEDARPLAGVRVLVPRTRARPGLLADRLRRLGADAVETVVSRLVPATDPGPFLAALPGADALVLADADEVAAIAHLTRQAGGDVRMLAGLTLVAAGDEAAAALEGMGLAYTHAPLSAGGGSAGPAAAGEPTPDLGAPALGAAASVSPALGVAVCGSASAPPGARTVRRVPLTCDALADADAGIAEQLRHGDVDVVAFASSTAASAMARLYGPLPARLRVAAMGPRTAAACRDAGLRVDAVAEHPGIHPLADAVVTAAGRNR
jgi:uroporphyrinogen III methyltransferase/synthase